MGKKKKKGKYIVWTCILLFFSFIFIKQQIIINNLDYQKKNSTKKIFELKQTQEILEGKIKHTSNQKYIEDEAREKLGMAKPGEIIFIDKSRQK